MDYLLTIKRYIQKKNDKEYEEVKSTVGFFVLTYTFSYLSIAPVTKHVHITPKNLQMG